MGRRSWVPAPKYLQEWAEQWLNGDGYDDAAQKAEDDRQPDPDRCYHEPRQYYMPGRTLASALAGDRRPARARPV
jgi:hypothetical protein